MSGISLSERHAIALALLFTFALEKQNTPKHTNTHMLMSVSCMYACKSTLEPETEQETDVRSYGHHKV